jgi:hypothetical protein
MGAHELTAFAVIAAILFWGSVICDLIGITVTAPWRESLSPQWRRNMLHLTIFCLVLALVVTGSLGLFRGMVTADETVGAVASYQPIDGGITDLSQSLPVENVSQVQPAKKESELYYWIPVVANACIPVLVLIGGVFSSWGLVMVAKFAMLIAGFILISPLGLFFFGSSLLMNILDRLYQFLAAVLRLFAAVGRAVLRLFGWKGGPPRNPGGGPGPIGPDDTDPPPDNSRGGSCDNNSGPEKGPKEETQETIKPSSDGWDPFGK